MVYIIIIGFIVGAVARFLLPGKNPAGCILTTLLGVAGSWLGSELFRSMGMSRPAGFIGSVIGALLILAILRFIGDRKS